jgi:hypothetical protein
MTPTDLTDLGTRYAAAWSSQNPTLMASFYAENGSLTVNSSSPSVGRAADPDRYIICFGGRPAAG